MPHPDGTRTRDEHRRELLGRTMEHVVKGMDPDEALTLAASEYAEFLQRESAQKTVEVMKFLGVKLH